MANHNNPDLSPPIQSRVSFPEHDTGDNSTEVKALLIGTAATFIVVLGGGMYSQANSQSNDLYQSAPPSPQLGHAYHAPHLVTPTLHPNQLLTIPDSFFEHSSQASR